MTCSWCGTWAGVKPVRAHIQTSLSRCNAVSPFDPTARCRRERGHGGRCMTDPAQVATFLCYRCFGVWKESGQRPPAYRIREPEPGPVIGRPLDLRRLR